MPTKTLYKVELDWDQKLSNTQMEIWKKFNPKASFKTIEDFEISSSDRKSEKYSSLSNEEIEQIERERFEEYINKPVKEITYSSRSSDNLIDLDEMLKEADFPFTIKEKRSFTFSHNSKDESMRELDENIDRLKNLNKKLTEITNDQSFNSYCNVHISGNQLLVINQLLLIEDACTDDVQKHLNSGWRIIAVCPQAQRRPDYVLGKYNPEFDTTINHALRG